MSNIKVKDLPEKIDNLSDDDLLIIEDMEDTKKISLIRLKSAFSMDGILTSMKDMLLRKINSFMDRHDSRYNELVDRNKQLEVTCNNLENNRAHDADRIFNLENNLELEKYRNNKLEEEKNKLLALIEELESEKESLSAKTIELEQLLSDNKSSIEELNSKISALENQSNELKNDNKELQDIITRMEDRANNKVDNFVEEVNTELSAKIEDLMAYIRHYHPDVDNI